MSENKTMAFDVLVLGTGLSESIVSAALSKAGFQVAHLDVNAYYGGNEASLTIDELVQWADEHTGPTSSAFLAAQRARFTSISRSSSIPPQSRQYSLSLAPSIIPSTGPLIDALIASGVSRYGGFKLLETVAIYDCPGQVKSVPGSKEAIFKNKSISLLDKRRLMRFLMFAAAEFEDKPEIAGYEDTPFVAFIREKFSLSEDFASIIAYALAFCISASDPTLPALQRIRHYLRSGGRYGPSPFLVGHYGGLGEIAQGFCRTSAVSGGTYVLGRRIRSIARSNPDGISPAARKYTVELEEFPEGLECDLIISAPDYLPSSLSVPPPPCPEPSHPVARCIAVLDGAIRFNTSDIVHDAAPPTESTSTDKPRLTPIPGSTDVDTALLIFPPGSLPDGSAEAAAQALITGEGTLSAPRGKCIVYLSLPLLTTSNESPESLLRPYLNATLSLASPDCATLFTLFYIENATGASSSVPDSDDKTTSSSSNTSVLVTPPLAPILPEIADAMTTRGEALFWKAVEILEATRTDSDEHAEIDVFWPPLEEVEEDELGGEDW